MADQVENLTKMPALVIEHILSHIPNLSHVSLTCKFFYESVCSWEKHRRVMHIRGKETRLTIDDDAVFDSIMNSFRTIKQVIPQRLTIDDDAVFDSIMNSFRTIKKVKLRVTGNCCQFNERQLLRLIAIMKQFGANITTLEVDGFVLSIDTIVELLKQTPNLESLIFANGAATGTIMEQTTIQLLNLKALEFSSFKGRSGICDLIPAGSLNYFRSSGAKSMKAIEHILTKQHNIKCLSLYEIASLPTNICINHLQLETLALECHRSYTNDDWVQILQHQTDLKELRIPNELPVSCFEWIYNNLKKLEVLEVFWKHPAINRNVFAMITELKKLRQFRIHTAWCRSGRRFQCDSLEKLEIVDLLPLRPTRHLKSIIRTMIRCFTNLTYLEMTFDDFAMLCFILSRCSTLISLSSEIRFTTAYRFTQQHFPNIQHLTVSTRSDIAAGRTAIGQNISALVRTMPNLKRLSMPSSNPIFNVNLMKEFIDGSKNLAYLSVDCFQLQPDICVDDLVDIIRRLANQLTGFKLTFKKRSMNSQAIKQIIDRCDVVDGSVSSSRFCLHKREGKPHTFSN